MHCSVFVTLLVAGLFGCSRQRNEYLIGAAGPQTLASGIQTQHGIDLAVEEINRAGGINGVPLRVIARDDRSSGAQAAKVAGEFVANERVVAVIGHAGSAAEVAAAHVYDGGRLAAVATTPSSPDLTGISPWVFRMISSDSVNGVMLAHFASSLADSLHRPLRVGVLYSNDAYGRGLSDAFIRNLRGAVLSDDPLSPNTDLEPYMAFYKIRKPDLIFVASDEELGIRILREAHKQQLVTTFLGGDAWQGVIGDSTSNGAYVATPFTAQGSDATVRQFVSAYRAKFGLPPNASASLAYDATKLVASAIQKAGPSRDGIRRYLSGLSQTNSFPALAGPMWFTATNDPVGDNFRITRVQGGTMVPVGGR